MTALRIGLSYRDAGSSDVNYERALMAGAKRAGVELELTWLGGHDRPFDTESPARMHGIVLTGGDDVDPTLYNAESNGAKALDHARDHVEQRLLETVPEVWEAPLLAICRGHQLLNVMTSKQPDALIQHLQTNVRHAREGKEEIYHDIAIAPRTMLADLLGATATVNSSHHQAVNRLADPFVVVATASDGTIEAYEWADPADRPWLLSVQWHPERLTTPSGEAIIDAFLAAVNNYATNKAH